MINLFKSFYIKAYAIDLKLLPDPKAGPNGSYELIDLFHIIGNVIEIALILVGVIAVIYLIMGGIKYITAKGDEEATGTAKATITYAIIGLVIAIAAYLVVQFVWKSFTGQEKLPTPESHEINTRNA